MFVADASMRFMFQNHVNSEEIQVRIFGAIPAIRVPLHNIEDIKLVSLRETLSFDYFFRALRFGIFGRDGLLVLISLRTPVPLFPFMPINRYKRLLLVPAQPEQFVRTLESALATIRGTRTI